MATIPRTYMTTSKSGLSSIPLRDGQVISIWDNDEVWYDAPANGQKDGMPVRRKISGIRVVSTLPEEPMTDIVYVYIGDHGYIPDPPDPEHPQLIYDLRVWVNEEWLIVGNNLDDTTVRTMVSNDKFYVVGTPDITDNVIGALRKNSAVYIENGELWGNLRGTADNAKHALQADLADQASKDVNDQSLTNYLYSVTASTPAQPGSVITFTRGDGNTTQVTVSDTTYNVFTSSTAGLVNGTNTTVVSDTTNLILSGSGWISTSAITMPSATLADKAVHDDINQTITSTYVKGASYDTSNDELTLTFGDGTLSNPISIPNSEYSEFTTDADGLVPGPTAAETELFLKGDGTWQSVVQPSDEYRGSASAAQDIFSGDGSKTTFALSRIATSLVSATVGGTAVTATLSQDGDQVIFDSAPTSGSDNVVVTYAAPGITGLVPPASAGEDGYYLRGDGTWGNTFDEDAVGLVPGPTSADIIANKVLQADGTWVNPTDTQNTTGSSNDTANKLYVVGAPTQSSAGDVTYSNEYIYILNNRLYQSNGDALNPASVAVVDTSSSQALTNKTYEGITLGNAAGATTSSNITSATPNDLPTNSAVISYVTTAVPTLVGTVVANKVDNVTMAPEFDSSVAYNVDDWCIHTENGDQYLWRCKSPTTAGDPFDTAEWDHYNVIEAIRYLVQHPT